jgi:hypothetical protein
MKTVTSMLMIDLFSGLGGASRAMKERGWYVITVEIDPRFSPNICIDITEYHYRGPAPDLIWASPPCQEFSKSDLPLSWDCNKRKPPCPDIGLMLHAKRVIEESNPRFWVIENVRGARPFFEPWIGKPRKNVGSRYLWGEFPIFDTPAVPNKWRRPATKDRAEKRSEIPEGISLALAMAIEQGTATI